MNRLLHASHPRRLLCARLARGRFARGRLAGRRGFTLIEIIVAMIFLTIGVMGVIALFLLGAKHNQESLENTRASVLALQIKSALVNALRYPYGIDTDGNGTLDEWWARFDLPRALEGQGTPPREIGDPIPPATEALDGFYFQIDDKTLLPYTDPTQDDQVLDLPAEGVEKPNSGAFIGRYVWWFREPRLNADISDDDDDEDISHFSFRLQLRRSVRLPSTGAPTPGDLFTCTITIYRDFQEFDGSVAPPELFQQPDNVPVFEYHFYVPVS